MALDTRLTRDPTELEAIYRFRFQVYYHELGAQLPDDVIRSGRLRCDFDDVAYNYVSFEGGRVVACLRGIDFVDLPNSAQLIEKYSLRPAIQDLDAACLGFTGRMAVAEKFRRSSLVHRLMMLATDDARQRGTRLAFLDCSPHLLPFYEAIGFRRYAPAFSDPVFGFKQPLLFMLRDYIGLNAIGSPLARTFNPCEDDPEIREWYARHYGAYATCRTATLLPSGALTDLAERVFSGELTEVPLLRNLSRQEIDLVLRKSTIVHAQPGDVVIRSGLRDEYLCVVLSGRLESHHAGHHLETMGRGGFYGETEFLTSRPRIAEVRACESAELLILPTEYLAQLIEKDVVIGRTLMRNLAIAMATRSAARLDGMAALSSQLGAKIHMAAAATHGAHIMGGERTSH
ncbi:MAG: GNAT family N-acetyltransferase [Nitrospira sp.]|nr:GNAT family N-acetyltransferase [Nitrospira sp.]